MTGIKGGKRNGREWWRAGRGGGSGYWLFLYPITPSCLTGLISRTEVHFAGVIQSRYARVVSSFPAAGALHFLFFWRGIFLSSVPNMEWRPSIECESKFIRLSRNWFFFFFFQMGSWLLGLNKCELWIITNEYCAAMTNVPNSVYKSPQKLSLVESTDFTLTTTSTYSRH